MSNLPIQFQDKVNSPELLALLQQFGPETYADAELINKFRDAINELNQALNPDRILSLGTETIDGNNHTYEGYSWQIGGIPYLMINAETITIPAAAVGFKRKDISVFTAQGTIIRVPGIETDGEIVVTPDVPQGTVYFKSYDINGDTIEVDPEPPVVDGAIFKKKSESAAFNDGSLSGQKAVIQLRPQGNSFYAITGAGLVSIDGFGLDLITGNPSAEPPYSGKDLIIQNLTAEPFDLLHDGDGMATAKFRFFNEQNLTVPPQGVVWVKYFTPYCEVVLKSWSDANNNYDLGDWLVNRFAHNNAVQPYLLGAALNGGNINTTASSNVNSFKTMTGVIFSSGTNANGGYRFTTPNTRLVSLEGLCTYGTFSLIQNSRDNFVQLGFFENQSGGANISRACLTINTDSVTLVTQDGGAAGDPSTVSASATLSVNTYYTFLVEFVTATSVRARIKETLTGVIVFDETNTTNAPAQSGQRFGATVTAQILTAGTSSFIIGLHEFSYGMKPDFLNNF